MIYPLRSKNNANFQNVTRYKDCKLRNKLLQNLSLMLSKKLFHPPVDGLQGLALVFLILAVLVVASSFMFTLHKGHHVHHEDNHINCGGSKVSPNKVGLLSPLSTDLLTSVPVQEQYYRRIKPK